MLRARLYEYRFTDGAGGTRPRRVLHEDGAHGDLERRAGRPPALRPVVREQRAVEAQQARLDAIARRAGNAAPRGQHGTA